MPEATVDIKEGLPQTVSLRTATTADFDFIMNNYDEGLGARDGGDRITRGNYIKDLLTKTEKDAAEGKQLVSFISYVGDKPAGFILLDKKGDAELEGVDLSAREISKIRKEEEKMPEAKIDAFVIAKEFQRNPAVLLKMVSHLLGIRENDQPFWFRALLREGTTHRLLTSSLLQQRLAEHGYRVTDTGVKEVGGKDTYHHVTLSPLSRWEKGVSFLSRHVPSFVRNQTGRLVNRV